MSANDAAPVIIKRKKVTGGDGHHGGAWKVAYADFVTAMMAFFMLMWLLNATTEKQRKGIADYFNPTVPVNRISGGGEGSFGGDDILTEETLARTGSGATLVHPTDRRRASGETGTSDAEDAADKDAEEKALQDIADALTARSGESMASEDLARHIVTRVTDEGLVVEIFDLPDAVLFEENSDEPTGLMVQLTAMMAEVFGLVKNEVAVAGYLRSQPVVVADNPVWDLSAGRADRVRLMLEETGLKPGRVQRISGFADRRPVAKNPMAPRNNRIELILLRRHR